MRGTASAASFRVIQVALIPVGTIGYLWAVPKLLCFTRQTRVSATLFASLYTRYMQHRLGARADDPASRLMTVMPNVSRAGFGLQTTPTMAAHFLTGYVPKIYRYPYEGEPPMHHQQSARTTFYDAALARHLPGINQLVILGAGMDTRVHRISREDRVLCFEIDQPETQAFKLKMMETAGLPTNQATYVAADFQAEDWFEKLAKAGFDPARTTFFLWEAVTMYLDRTSVEATLQRIALTAPGSVIAFDYYDAGSIASPTPYMRYLRETAKFAGEPFTFGIDNTPPARKRAADYVRAFGLTLEEHRNFGKETRRRPAPAGFVTATVGGTPIFTARTSDAIPPKR
ncbi:hypothetical protein ASF98_05825 [Arthrobacter sp. Leaf337]|uniref:class I SAM-dependent methyltransferase n=1 Tax=Arthrobacter sp. Leaf337 TaxID=1736342 RepID=UPI0006FB0197|nr:SAM-dependent methyltransferase [Arthrobacter sp. Leaf337]KQR75346.1 hypothetical protein ASF98_05825 [Arthrobacter sp. Leaf337]